MKRKNVQRLLAAIAAAAVLTTYSERAISLELSASKFLTDLDGYVANGDLAAAKDALLRLQAMGVKQIKVGQKVMTINELLALLNNRAKAHLVLADLIKLLPQLGGAYFVGANLVAAGINVKSPSSTDHFPTGSAG